MGKKCLVLFAVVILLPLGANARAQVPPLINFTGYAQTQEGPIEGNVTLTISLYDNENAPVDQYLWRDSFDTVATSGRFSVLLGSSNPLPDELPAGGLYLGIMVNGGQELSPRLKIASVPYAFECNSAAHALQCDNAQTSETLQGYTPDRFVLAPSSCSYGQVIKFGSLLGDWICAEDNDSGGTVTSVALDMPQEFTLSGSPITSSGTISATWAPVGANTVLAGPVSGGSGAPMFRALVPADIPGLNASQITSGVLPVSRGGTGLDSPGPVGNLLRSDGSSWESWTPNFLTTEADGIVGNEVVGPADSTLTRSGSGSAADPYKLALNLTNPNTWTGLQSFNPTGSNAPFKVDPSKTDVVTYLNADMLDGKHATDFALSNHTHDLAGSTITGVLPVSKGGTGLSSPGTAGNLLRSDGSSWQSWTPNFLTSEVDGIVGNEVIDRADTTLVRSGSGTANDPYKLALNLANPNTWTGLQRFNPSSGTVPFAVDSSKTGVVTNLNADMLDGLHSTSFALTGTVWELTGNANTDPSVNFLGTTDQKPVVFRSNKFKVLSLEWKQGTSGTDQVVSANVIGVPNINSAHASAIGVVIGGGGAEALTGPGTGHPNTVSQSFAAIVGGTDNAIGRSDIFSQNTAGSFIGGGASNKIVDSTGTFAASFATIVGGLSNTVQGDYGFIGGGQNNTVGRTASAICGGAQNQATNNYSFVGGGYQNQALGVYSVVAGGNHNFAVGDYGFVGGGGGNNVSDTAQYAAIVGGAQNQVGANYAFIGAGQNNIASGTNAFVGGGENNHAFGFDASVGGGSSNTASGDNAFVAGGGGNTASGNNAFVGGGSSNSASGYHAFVGGGGSNNASGLGAFIGGGGSNEASGDYAFVAGGIWNIASGKASFAGGAYAKATENGCFVWRGYEGGLGTSPLTCEHEDQFLVKAKGGVKFCIDNDNNSCCELKEQPGGTGAQWDCFGTIPSDRRWKSEITSIDPLDVLDRVATLEVTTWRYKDAPTVRHIGPMAKDFYDLFGFGSSEQMISEQDLIGVTLAAVQGLNIKVDSEVETLKRQVEEQNREIERLRAEIAQLKAMLGFQKAR